MKGNKMNAILAILLMLSGTLLFSHASAVNPLTVQASPASVNFTYPAQGPGSSFYVNITVSNAVHLFSYQSGFKFNAAALQVTNVTDGDFLIKPGMVPGSDYLAFAGKINNTSGIVTAYVVTLLNTLLNQTGSGTLFKVGFKVNPALWPPYTGAFPGSAVSMMHFNITSTDLAALILTDVDGNLVTPGYPQISDGLFTLSVTPHGPTASLAVTPASVIVGTTQTFDASGSTPGWNGYANVPIDWYYFRFGDGNTLNQSGAVTTHTYAVAGTYTANVTVHAGITESNSKTSTATVLPPAFSVNISPTTATLDVGQSQTFTSSVSYGTAPYSYQWYLNGVAVSGATGSSWAFAPSGSGAFSVYVNVTDSASQRAKSNIASVTVHSAPSVSVSPASATITVGQSQVFSSSVSGGTSPYSYQWYLNGSAVSGAFSGSWTFTPASTGTYEIYVNITDAVGVIAYSSNAQLKVNPPIVIANLWPMFRYDLTHDGYSTSMAPSTNFTLWSYATGHGVWSSPAVAGGLVYVGSADGKVYALNAATGAYMWNYSTGGAVDSSPAVADGVVYVGSNDGKVYALNATSGAMVWSYATGSAVSSSPAVADGVVYVGSSDGKVYALNAGTGVYMWSHTTGDSVESSPAVSDGIVFVGSVDQNVYALNATTGAYIWSYATWLGVWSSPAVAYGLVFVGSGNGNVYALSAASGAMVWSYATGSAVSSSPAVADGVVYVGSSDGKVYALNAGTGVYMWSYMTGSVVSSSPAVAGGLVFVGSYDDSVYALNASTGAYVWSYKTGFWVYSSPAVAGGLVFIGSGDGKIYAFGQVSMPPPPPAVTSIHTALGISGYKLIFQERMNNSLGSQATINYSWSFTVDKWNGLWWAATSISGSSAIVTGYNINAFTQVDLPYFMYALNSSTVKWGDWLRIRYTFHWTYEGTNYSTTDVAELNVHPGDIAGVASITLPYLGADSVVNLQDVLLIANGNWNQPVSWAGPYYQLSLRQRADINGDGLVNLLDLNEIVFNWGKMWTNSPPP